MTFPRIFPKWLFQSLSVIAIPASFALVGFWGWTYSGPWRWLAHATSDRHGEYDVVLVGLLCFVLVTVPLVALILLMRLFTDMPGLAEQRRQWRADPRFASLAATFAPSSSAAPVAIASDLASPARRMAAFAIDRTIGVALVLLGLSPVVAIQFAAGDGGFRALAWLAIPLMLPGVAYLWARDAIGGRSLARRMLGMQVVVEATRQPIGAVKSLQRELLLHFAPLLGLEVVFLLQRLDRRRLGDQFAKTIVIRL